MDAGKLKKRRDLEKKRNLAANSSTPLAILRELAKDKDDLVRANVALNPSTPLDILRKLATDTRWVTIRQRVARNINTPDDILRELATDKDPRVREDVINNPKATTDILVVVFEYERSSKYPAYYILKSLYTNPKLPYVARVIIETLYGDRL